jgi:hypothetical protein
VLGARDVTGGYVRKTVPRPSHTCDLPLADESERRDVWLCDCGRMYIWSDASGYGFGWRRVIFRYWWFRGVKQR